MQQIAQQLGVKSILEGGVQRAGDRVRINVQLIDAPTDAHHWAENFDRELTVENMFAIQSELAVAIAGVLKTTLTPAEQARANSIPTTSLEAWESYQLGKQRMARRTTGSLAEAERYFRDAIQLDPAFALAHAELATTLALQIPYSGKARDATLGQVQQAATRALDLDANLAEAWSVKGLIAMDENDNASAYEMLRRAIELNPNDAAAHHWLSQVYRVRGQFDGEFEHAQRAFLLDPLSVVANVNFGDTLQIGGRLDDAAARYRRAMEIDPRSPAPLVGLAWLEAYGRNHFKEAVTLLERAVSLDPKNPRYHAFLAAFTWI